MTLTSDFPHDSNPGVESLSRPCYVYFISAGSAPIKIGVSDRPESRLADLQTAHYQRLHLIYTLECRTRSAAFEVEAAFHRWYEDLRIRNEWFRLTPKRIEADVRLLTSLAGLIVSAHRYVSTEQIEHMEAKAAQHQADARVRVREHLGNFPSDMTLPVRELADKLGVGKTTVAEVKREMKANG